MFMLWRYYCLTGSPAMCCQVIGGWLKFVYVSFSHSNSEKGTFMLAPLYLNFLYEQLASALECGQGCGEVQHNDGRRDASSKCSFRRGSL